MQFFQASPNTYMTKHNTAQYIESFLGLQEVIDNMPGVKNRDRSERIDVFDIVVTDTELREFTRKLFSDGHHARSVEEAFKFLNNLVKERSMICSADGSGLMKQVFSANCPILKLNTGNSPSEKDEQLGYMEIFAGCMTGVRNPRAHEHNWEDTETRALQLLSPANHLVDRVRLSQKAP